MRMAGQLALVLMGLGTSSIDLVKTWSCLLDTESRHVRRLGVTLQRLAGLAVNSHDHTVGVTGKVDSNLNLDFAQLFLDLLLLFRFAPLDVGAELA
jgi:hypothetical protein